MFPTPTTIFKGLDKSLFREMLKLSIYDSHFLFNGTLFKQVDGCAMGSPLGPVLANIFMNSLETEFLESCPTVFKPMIYKRYVDDTFAAFSNSSQANAFLDFINSKHPNINFTMELENNNSLPFLDVLVSKNDVVTTSVYRKKTFTGLGCSFYSYTPLKYKIGTVKALIHQGFKLCSNWAKFHSEMEFLQNYFTQNGYPSMLFNKLVHDYLYTKVF